MYSFWLRQHLRKNFRAKILVMLLLFTFIMSLSFTAVFVSRQAQILKKNMIHEGELLAELLAYNSRLAVFTESVELLDNSVNGIMEQKDVLSVTIYNQDAKMLKRQSVAEGQLKRQTKAEAEPGRQKLLDNIRATRLPLLLDQEKDFTFIAPVVSYTGYTGRDSLYWGKDAAHDKSRIIGFVEISVSKDRLVRGMETMVFEAVVLAVVFLGLTVVATLIASKRLTMPLKGLTGQVRSFSLEGEVGRVIVESEDEIGELARAFNEMADSLKIRDEEKSKLEEKLIQAQKLEALTTLAGGISHDFNNILTAFMANIALARMYAEPGDKVYHALLNAETALMQAKDLSCQLLAFSRGSRPVKRSVSIPNLLQDTVSFILCGSPVKSEFFFEGDLLAVYADRGQITQVINNIVINALQAMPGGGTIEIRAVNIKDEEKKGLPLKNGDYVKISFKDSGTGMDPEIRAKIFNPFFTTKEDGNGLGLATAFAIVSKHGGFLDVESEKGKGSAFHVYLPALHTTAPDHREEDSCLPALEQGRVLLMDDEEDIRYLVGELLEGAGYSVELAKDGLEVLEFYLKAKESDNPFDVVIIDLTIPGGRGGEWTIEKIRQIDPEVKAILASGYPDSALMAEYWKYGFKSVIAKPYKIEELREALAKVLQAPV